MFMVAVVKYNREQLLADTTNLIEGVATIGDFHLVEPQMSPFTI
jgi:hypothetical protein